MSSKTISGRPVVLRPVNAGEPKIRLFINHDHIARVMRRRRELGIGEDVAA